jgi:hypothetical protein
VISNVSEKTAAYNLSVEALIHRGESPKFKIDYEAWRQKWNTDCGTEWKDFLQESYNIR